MLTDIGADDGLPLCDRVELIEDVLRAQSALLAIFEWIFFPPPVDLGPPSRGVRRLHQRKQGFGDQSCVTLDADVGHDHLVEFCGIDVDVNFSCPKTKLIQLARNTVIPSRANRHDQVCCVGGFIRVRGPMHAQHAQVQGMGFVRTALTKQGGHHGSAQPFGQVRDRL